MSRRPFGWDLPPGVRYSDLPGNEYETEECNCGEPVMSKHDPHYCANCGGQLFEEGSIYSAVVVAACIIGAVAITITVLMIGG